MARKKISNFESFNEALSAFQSVSVRKLLLAWDYKCFVTAPKPIDRSHDLLKDNNGNVYLETDIVIDIEMTDFSLKFNVCLKMSPTQQFKLMNSKAYNPYAVLEGHFGDMRIIKNLDFDVLDVLPTKVKQDIKDTLVSKVFNYLMLQL